MTRQQEAIPESAFANERVLLKLSLPRLQGYDLSRAKHCSCSGISSNRREGEEKGIGCLFVKPDVLAILVSRLL